MDAEHRTEQTGPSPAVRLRRVLDGIVALLREELGDELRAVWL